MADLRPGLTRRHEYDRLVNLAEELKLCSIGDDGLSPSPRTVAGLGGALAAELALAGRVRIDGGDALTRGRFGADRRRRRPVLQQQHRGRGTRSTATANWAASLSTWINQVGVRASPRVHQALVDGGLVTIEQGERSWMVVVRKPDRYVITEAGEEPRARLRAVLLGEREPDALYRGAGRDRLGVRGGRRARREGGSVRRTRSCGRARGR